MEKSTVVMEEVACEICGSAEYNVLLDKLWLCERYNWKLEELERKGFFDFRRFVFERFLSYIGLFEIREILKKQQS